MMTNRIILVALAAAATAVQSAEPAALRPSVERMAHACAGCHGTFGHSIAPTPSLAGKPEEAFINAMHEFKSGQRVSSIMNRIARAYTDDDIAALAQFFKKR
jgi:sulfide dehydrogenase cytochrome subunit